MNDLRTATKAEAPFDCTLSDTNQRCLTLTHEPKRCRISASRISILMSQTLGQHTRIQHRLAPKPRPSRTVASIYHFAAIVQYPESPEIRGSWLGQVDTSASKTRSPKPRPNGQRTKTSSQNPGFGRHIDLGTSRRSKSDRTLCRLAGFAPCYWAVCAVSAGALLLFQGCGPAPSVMLA